MKDKRRMRVRNVAFGSPLQEQDDEFLHMGEGLDGGALLVFLPGVKRLRLEAKGRII
jgi:hypothetical protein